MVAPGLAIELWASAEANERRPIPQVDTEAAQDELDELMLQRGLRGEYGAACRAALEECTRQGRFASRRAFLREARRAAATTREHP